MKTKKQKMIESLIKKIATMYSEKFCDEDGILYYEDMLKDIFTMDSHLTGLEQREEYRCLICGLEYEDPNCECCNTCPGGYR